MKFQIILVLALALVASAERATQIETERSGPSNPCTEEVLRSPEIQAFRDPLDRTSYIVCTEVNVFVRMPCATGTFFDTTIRHCVPEGWTPPVCPVGLCQNQADCIIDEMKNEYKCLCRVGFTGLFCETNIDECALEGNQVCQKSGGRCVDQLNAYYCDFGEKIGINAENSIEKPCTLLDLSMERQFFELPSPLNNVYVQCTGELEWVVSKCADMLFWNQELKTCTIEQPLIKTGVCKNLPCKNDGICEDLGNFQFMCMCPAGFTGELCEEEIDFCIPSPCGAGRCVSHRGGYNCVCEDRIVDKSCDRVVVNPCSQSLDYFPYTLNNTRYISCGMEGLAFVKDCAPGTFWEDSFKTCRLPEVIPVLPQRPMMSIFDTRPQMTVQPAYNGYAQETRPMMVPTVTMAPRYNGYQQTKPTLSFTTTTTTPMTTTTTMAPKYNGYAQETRPMMVPTVTMAPKFNGYQQIRPTLTFTTTTTTPMTTTTTMAPKYNGYNQVTRPMMPTFEQTRPMFPTFEQTRPMMPTFEQTRPMMPTFEKTRPMIPTRPAY